MSRSRNSLSAMVCALCACGALYSACESQGGKLDPAMGGAAGSAGEGGSAGAIAEGGEGGSAGSNPAAQGGSSGGSENEGGSPGVPTGGAGVAPRCVFHTDALLDPPSNPSNPSVGGAASAGLGGAGGEGGDASAGAGGSGESGAAGEGGSGGEAPVYSLTVRKNAFVGTHLADANGRSLYVFGADFPGDCENHPVTNCFKECAVAWPIFFAGARALPEGLDDGLFGDIQRSDGLWQTTYRGWPLYYYKNDVAPGDAKGQAVGLWHLAEVELPNVVILRVGTQRFLANGEGRALYTFEDDTLGTSESAPISACTGACRENFPPFTLKYVSPVSYLELSNFTMLTREDGATQVAYKGAPLYFATVDNRSGDLLATGEFGWSAAAP